MDLGKLRGNQNVLVFILLGSILMTLVTVRRLNSSEEATLLALPSFAPKDAHFEFSSGVSGCTEDEEQIYKLDRKDQCLAAFVRKYYLLPPSKRSYNFSYSKSSYVSRYTKFLYGLFPNMIDGTFIEVRAYDGEEGSMSLLFELKGWTGLLIECNPLTLSKLLSKHRKAWIAPVCLSTISTPEVVTFNTLKLFPAAAQVGRPLNDTEMKYWKLDRLADTTWYNYSLPAFPLYSILKGTGEFTQIDLLTLDVQGIELKVLTNFPFEDFQIKVIIAEYDFLSKEDQAKLRKLMETKG